MRGPYATPRTFTSGIAVSDTDSGAGFDDALTVTAAITGTDAGAGADTESITRTTVALADMGIGQDDAATIVTALSSTDAATGKDRQSGEGSYQLVVASDNPVGYWRLGESTGTVAYDFMGNYDGTYVGTPTLAAAGALYDNPDTSVDFDAEGDYITAPNPKSTPGTGSIEAWVHTGTWEDTGRHGIFQNVPTWGNTANFISLFRWSGSTTENGPFYFRIVSPDGTLQDISPAWSSIMRKNTWNHVVATWDATHMRMYINGREVASRAYTPPTSFPSTDIRWAFGHQYSLRGRGDEFALYDVALTSAQVLEHYEEGIHMLSDGDSGAAADANTNSAAAQLNADTASALEDAAPSATLTQTDSAVGAEPSSDVVYAAGDTDAGTGGDAEVAYSAALSDTDVAAATTEANSITSGGATTDSAIAIEAEQLLVVLSQADTGLGGDAQLRIEEFFSADTATATDTEALTRLASILLLTPPHTQQRYEHFVLDDRPVGYWRLGEATGTVASDETGNGNDGTYTAGIIRGVVGPLAGNTDTAAGFPLGNHSDNITATIGAIEHAAAWSAEAWVMPQEATDGNTSSHRTIMASSQFRLQYTPAASLTSARFLIQPYNAAGGTSALYDPATRTNVNGIWWHVVATYDGTVLRLYINGTLVSSLTVALRTGTFTTVRMGYDGLSLIGGADALRGSLDEPAIYSRALSASEVAEHYAVGRESRYGFMALEPTNRPAIVTETVDAYQFDWATTPA